jgi:diadenosine tetraphosphate (Ap4A) HIT family hydrolase
MDIFPPTFDGKITMPVVLVCTKKHLGSDVFENLSDEEYSKLLAYVRKIAKATKCALNPERVCLVFEGMEIDHIHAKLYPIFKESYPGWLSTKKSLNNENIKALDELLSNYAAKIREQLEIL